MNKIELRKHIREQKRAMTSEQISDKSRELTDRFLKTQEYACAKTIYAYMPYNQEVRTVPIIEKALADGKRVAVPKIYGDEMRFIYITDFDHMEKSSCGIPEPVDDGPVGDDPTALVLMPGLAFDKEGHRIGYGGGFYDKFLEQEPDHPTIALCYDFQIVQEIPTDIYDIPVDRVIWA